MPTSTHLFDAWAPVYDTQPNPLLHLEDRTLPPLLPPLPHTRILDVGCGTGRWLRRFEHQHPASLTGIDPSPAMLRHARARLAPTTHLQQGEASALPGQPASTHLILASFVLSYLADLDTFARECARILRPHAHLLLTDMHPVTAQARRWTRSFRTPDPHSPGTHLEITPHTRSLPTILETFQQHRFHIAALLEPAFALPERPLFAATGKLANFDSLQHLPALYLLKLQLGTP